MIDFGCISVFFKDEFVKKLSEGAVLLPSIKTKLPVTWACRCDFDESGNAEVSRLNHKFDSIPSSFSSLAFLIVDGTDFVGYPYIRICASPAKLLQGHNVYGSDNTELCLFALVEAFCLAMPELSEYLDWPTAALEYIDITYTAHVGNDNTAIQLLQVLKNVSGGQTRNRTSDDFLTTVYWGKGTGKNRKNSRRKQLKAYLKAPELENSIKEVHKRLKQNFGDPVMTQTLTRQLIALNQPDVQEMAKGAVRFESRLFASWLRDAGYNTSLFEFLPQTKEPAAIRELWRKSWNDIFKAFEGAKMHLHDDQAIHEALKAHFYKELKSGAKSYTKANRLFNFFNAVKTRGFETVYRETDRATLGRYLADLKTAGISRAQLQNLTAETSNVVPLVKLINVDFHTQHPASWQEPKPLSAQVGAIKLAS